MRHGTIGMACGIGAVVLALAAPHAGARGELPAGDRCPGGGGDRAQVELAYGCTAIQLVRRPEVVDRPVLASLDDDAVMLDRDPALAEPARELRLARIGFVAADAGFRRGTLCPSAGVADAAAAAARDAAGTVERLTDAQAAQLAAARDRSSDGDVEQGELQIASWRLQHAIVERTATDAAGAAQAFGAVCSAIVAPLDVRGVVAARNDAAGTITLDAGTTFGRAAVPIEVPAWPGTRIAAHGVAFADGTGLATSVTGPVSNGGGIAVLPCASLRVAPVQPQPASLLQQPRAYQDAANVLQLEEGMALGTALGTCPAGNPNGGVSYGYALKIDITQGGSTQTLAAGLSAFDDPVPLPGGFAYNTPFTISTTVFRSQCINFGQGVHICQPPALLSTTSYTAVERPLGSYAVAAYDTTAFGVTDDGVAGDWEPAHVTGASTLPGLPAVSFGAEGYRVTNGVSSRPSVQPVAANQPFAVYADDFYDPGYLFNVDEFLATGTTRPSGLRWAHVDGTRNGSPFRYVASLPPIVHDRIAQCPVLPSTIVPMGGINPKGTATYPTYPPAAPYTTQTVGDSYYKLPFPKDTAVAKNLNGNIDDPNQTRRHPEWQAYAVDLNEPSGTPVLAARGGVVTFVQESDPYNIYNPTPAGATAAPPGWTGIGNYVFVESEDGTYAVYFHLEQNSVIPGVGDTVRRGDPIGTTGMTGNASGPHVHIGVATNPTSNQTLYVKRIRWQAKVGDNVNSCYIPRSTDAFSSTNDAPTGD